MTFIVQMQNVLLFFILFGLWSPWHNFKRKWIEISLKIFAVLSIVSFLILFPLTILIDSVVDFNALPNIVSNVLLVLLFVTHSVILIESILKTQAQEKLINTFSMVDHLFYAKLGIGIPYRSEKFVIFARLLFLAMIEIALKLSIIVSLILSHTSRRFGFIAFFSNFVICLRMLQTIFFMNLLQNRLMWFSRELIDILRSISPNSTDIQLIPIYRTQTIPLLHELLAKRSIHDRLIDLKHIYTNLFDICKQIDDSFGWSLLLTVVFIFATVTYVFYWAYISLDDAHTVLLCLLYFIPIVIILCVLAYYCSLCCRMVCMLHSEVLVI